MWVISFLMAINTDYYYFSFESFFTPALADAFSLEFEWQQVFSTLLSILANLNNAVVWMVSICPIISKSSSPCANPLVTLPKTPITIGIIVTLMLHSFFNSLARSRYLALFSHSFNFTQWSTGTAKSTILQVFFYFFFLLLLLRDLFVFQNPRGVCAFHSLGQILGCAYTICPYGQTSTSCTIPIGSPYFDIIKSVDVSHYFLFYLDPKFCIADLAVIPILYS